MLDFQLSPRQEKMTIQSRIKAQSLKEMMTLVERYLKTAGRTETFQRDLPAQEETKFSLLSRLLKNANIQLSRFKNALNESYKPEEIVIRTTLTENLFKALNGILETKLLINESAETAVEVDSLDDAYKFEEKAKQDVTELEQHREKLLSMKAALVAIKEGAAAEQDDQVLESPGPAVL